LNFRGLWAVESSYQPFDVVMFYGSSFIAVFENIGVSPVNEETESPLWKLIASKGDMGDRASSPFIPYAPTTPTSEGVYSGEHGISYVRGFSASLRLEGQTIPKLGVSPRIPPGFTRMPGYYYDVIVDANKINLTLTDNSFNVFGRTVNVLLFV